MSETEKMQRLHHLAATGAALSEEETQALSGWYAQLDRDEAVINNQNRSIDLETLRAKLEKTTGQIVAVSASAAELLKQNEVLRGENVELRRQLEARLVREKQAA